MTPTKNCSVCGIEYARSLEFFYKKAKAYDGLRPDCKNCMRKDSRERRRIKTEYYQAYKRRYRAANGDKVRESTNKWRSKNPESVRQWTSKRRALKREVSHFKVTKKDHLRIMAMPCIYCGGKSEHVDHVIPLARGGLHSVGNLAPACSRCNTSKGAKLVSEWRYSR